MKVNTIEALLKDKTPIQIREAKQQDAPQLIDCVSKYIADTDYALLTSQEFKPTIVEEAQWIRKFVEEDNSLLLVAVKDHKIIGNIDVKGSQRLRLWHNGHVGLGMLKEYRGKGLGTLLLQTAIDWAHKNKCLERLWLDVYANNTIARALYSKMGFKEEGIQKSHIKHNDVYIDNVIMGRGVKDT